MKQVQLLLFVLLFLHTSTPKSLAQINGWDLIKGLIKISENATKLSDECFQLTEDRLWAGGTIYYPNKIDLTSNFDMELDVFLGCKDADGADGMVFIFSPKMAMGREGEGIGYGGVSPSIGIEIDTWQNEHIGDPYYDHIAILQNGNLNHRNGLTKPVNLGKNIEDCQNHRLRITWNALDKRLAVGLDGKQIVDLQKDLVQDIFLGESEVFWGVSSATGKFSNEHKVCFEKINFKPASATANSIFKKTEAALLDSEIAQLSTQFNTGQITLTEDSYKELDELTALLRKQPEMYLNIYGYTDNLGGSKNNQRLSQKRAEAIVDYLSKKGIAKDRLLARGMGDTRPIASNATAEGRKQNRRIEVYLYKPYP